MPLFHTSLFNPRFLAQRASAQPAPAEHKKLLHDWAATIRDGCLRRQKETEVRGAFIQRFFVEILGYRPFGSGAWTINDEHRTGGGSADTALGHFSVERKTVIAPVELKGADTPDLDAIMPGRYKSPVQQVWEYAMDTPGCQFLLVSNMLEIRLYAVGHTRQVYERFDILELADSDAAYQRFRLLLAADRLLSGETAQLLRESALAERAITQKLYSDYKTWRISLLLALLQHNEGDAEALIEPAQKLLDRVLFIAFAEDRGLLPPKSLAQAWSHRDPYQPRPIWSNFLGLFRAIDQGNAALGIPAYNGGLFAADGMLDALAVPDDACRMFAGLGEYDFADDVSVTVLGHIFEQSVSDLEQLKELAGSEGFSLAALEAQVRESARSVSGKRKQDGIVYTPDAITRFIVDETLGTYLADRQAALRAEFATVDGGWRRPTEAEKKLAGARTKLKDKTRLVEFLFWHAWREALRTIRVVDPACGSGAFLVAAFDLLDAEYRRVNEQIQAITGNPDLFDINREILNGNLYGVDLNPESIEITKLSLWLKTAQRGKPLESLEANLRVGNSLIDDSAYTPRPFGWPAAFPEIFPPPPPGEHPDEHKGLGERERALDMPSPLPHPDPLPEGEGVGTYGFDVVLGNPPYVRMERLKAIKPYLEQRYAVASDRADLYAYFYELGLALLKPGGRLGYISSSTFFKTGSGEPLRRHLLEHSRIRALVDFGDIQVFEGVTTYPAIVVLDKTTSPPPSGEGPGEREPALNQAPVFPHPSPAPRPAAEAAASAGFGGAKHASRNPTSAPEGEGETPIRFLALGDALPDSLAAEFNLRAGVMPQSQLGADAWRLESPALARLRAKLTDGHPTLKAVYGSPLYGIKTGLNEAFVVDRATRDRLIAQDPKSAELLKPFLEGKDLKKWRIEPQDLWLIYVPKNRVDIDAYPSIKAHLLPFREALEKRATKQAWFELQQAQEAYVPKFEAPKVYYPDMSQGPKFVIDKQGYYAGNTSYFVPNADWYLLALLNSRLTWFQLRGMAEALRGGEWRLRLFAENVEKISIPASDTPTRALVAQLAESAQRAAEARRDLQAAFRRRILTDLAPGGATARLAGKLSDWPSLDFKAFHDEVKRQFKSPIPLAERDAWQARFETDRARVGELSDEIARCEREIDRLVYALFGLTEEEIRLVEGQVSGRQA